MAVAFYGKIPDIRTVAADASAVRIVQAQQQLYERCLAGAVVAYERDFLLCADMQADVF